jgi:hypothetical protein
MHGAKEETHNSIVNVPKARKFQIRRLDKISERMAYCCNYVMVEKNQSEMLEWAEWLVARNRKPKVVNFINFNAFGPWLKNKEWIERGKANVIDLRVATPILDSAITLLEDNGIGVNVRYFPMCGLSEGHRKNVCNDLHVAFDFGEWDNSIPDHSVESGERYGKNVSSRNELQAEPCTSCGHKQICGGANHIWHKLAVDKFGDTPLVQLGRVDSPNYWHYRQHNVLGLDPRR